MILRICLNCGSPFATYGTMAVRKFCSQRCRDEYSRRKDGVPAAAAAPPAPEKRRDPAVRKLAAPEERRTQAPAERKVRLPGGQDGLSVHCILHYKRCDSTPCEVCGFNPSVAAARKKRIREHGLVWRMIDTPEGPKKLKTLIVEANPWADHVKGGNGNESEGNGKGG